MRSAHRRTHAPPVEKEWRLLFNCVDYISLFAASFFCSLERFRTPVRRPGGAAMDFSGETGMFPRTRNTSGTLRPWGREARR